MYASPESRGTMPSSSKPRKKGRSSGMSKADLVASNPLIRHDAETETRLQLVPHMALTRFRYNQADEGDYHTVAMRVFVGYVLASQHFPKAVSLIEESADLLNSVQAIGESTGFWSMHPDAADKVGIVLTLIDEMQKMCTRAQLIEAYEFVKASAGKSA